MSSQVYIKAEYDSDLEIADESSDNDSSDDIVNPVVILSTNYHDTRLPMLEDFRGQYNFRYRLPCEGSSIKPTWEYSVLFNQVFIRMDRVLVVQFSFETAKVNLNDLFIRAVLVYSSADHIFYPVNRCAVHAIEDDPLSKAHADKDRCLCTMYELAGHVVRCKSSDAIYCYDPKSERHSVLCPVRNTTDLLYSFSCKNSCPKGMHRRATKLVFTLENSSGKMLGRSSLDIKVCSCPRRDREKLEKHVKPSVVNSGYLVGNPKYSSAHSPSSNSYESISVPPSSVSVHIEEDDDEEDRGDDDSLNCLPGEVIMKIRSEVRNIRQALTVIERRFSHVQDLLNQNT